MAKFRKKPVVIEAERLGRSHLDGTDTSLIDWCGAEVVEDAVDGPSLLIDTLEGQMKARPGDWIIKGVSGEFYPCKPDIFAATYEMVDDA